MKKLTGLALQGLAVALPFVLTIYFVYWSISTIEGLVRATMAFLGLDELYIPGTGVVIFVVALLALGLVARMFVFRSLLRGLERIFESMPLVKSVYSAVRDFMDFIAGTSSASGAVVSLEVAGMRVLGIVADTAPPPSLVDGVEGDEVVGVFLPMSYQLGGYTIYVPRSALTPVDMDAESAMRYIMTAGIGRGGSGAGPAAVSSAG